MTNYFRYNFDKYNSSIGYTENPPIYTRSRQTASTHQLMKLLLSPRGQIKTESTSIISAVRTLIKNDGGGQHENNGGTCFYEPVAKEGRSVVRFYRIPIYLLVRYL